MGSINQFPLLGICFSQSLKHPSRTLLLVLGIALGVSGVVSIDVARTSVAKSFDLSIAAVTAQATHQITGSDFTIPQSIFSRLRTELGIHTSAPVITAHARVRELDNKTLTLTGIDPFSETLFRQLPLAPDSSGNQDLSGLLTRTSGVLIAMADKLEHNIDLNDELTLSFGDREVRVVVSGFLDGQDEQARQVLSGLLVMDISLAQEILGLGDQISRIDLILNRPDQVNLVRKILPPGALIVETSNQNQVMRNMSQSFETSLTAFSMLALFMGIFLIYNTVSFSVSQRRKLNGTLRAIGATRREIFTAVMSEVLLYAVAGSFIGVLLGIGLGHAAVRLVCGTVSDLYFVLTVSQTHVSGASLAKGVAAGLVSSLCAAAFPAWSAAMTRPITLMQTSASEGELKKYIRLLALAGLFITATAAVLLLSESLHPGLDFPVIFIIFLGYSLLAPFFIQSMIRALEWIIRPFSSILGRMAMGNIVRALSRTSVLIASLMVVVSVYIGVDTMTQSFRQSIIDWVDGHIGADIHVSSADTLKRSIDPLLVEKIEQLPAVKTVSAYNIHRILSRSSGEIHIFSYLKDLSVKEWTWAAGPPEKMDTLLADGQVLVSEIFARKHGITPGPGATVLLDTGKGPVSFGIAGIFRDFFMGGGRVIVSRSVMREFWGYDDITSIQVFLKKDRNIRPVQKQIRSMISPEEMVKIISGRDIKANILAVFNKTFIITSALQILTAIVALTGILNSVMALLFERTREFGILRACGAQQSQLVRLLLTECGLCGLIAGVMAFPLGGFLAWVLIHVINQRSFGWSYEFIFNPLIFLQAAGFACLAAVVAGIYPAVSAGRTDISTALRME